MPDEIPSSMLFPKMAYEMILGASTAAHQPSIPQPLTRREEIARQIFVIMSADLWVNANFQNNAEQAFRAADAFIAELAKERA